VAVIIVQLNLALILQMSGLDALILQILFEERLGLRFEQAWGVPTLLVTGFAGSLLFVGLSCSRRHLLPWLAASIPIAVFFTVAGRTLLGSTLVFIGWSWPGAHVALMSAALGSYPGVVCGRKVFKRGKGVRDRLRLTIWLVVLSLTTVCLYLLFFFLSPTLY
jgi:hypothetical protein